MSLDTAPIGREGVAEFTWHCPEPGALEARDEYGGVERVRYVEDFCCIRVIPRGTGTVDNYRTNPPHHPTYSPSLLVTDVPSPEWTPQQAPSHI